MLSFHSGRRPAAAAPDLRREGFTLAELVVALVLLSLVVMAVLSMVTSQSRYVGQINTDVQMLDQVRAANELLGSEIADLPRGAMRFARRDSISFRLPVQWGIVCGATDRQAVQAKKTKLKKGETAVTATSNMAINFEPQADVLGDPAPEGLAVSANGTTFAFYTVSNWASLGLVRSDSAGQSCLDASASPAGKKKAPRPKKNNLPPPPIATVIESLDDYYETTAIGTLMGQAPEERSLIFGYVKVSYFLKPLAGSGTVLYRSTANGTQKLAWPFTPNSGFTYRLDDLSTSTTVDSLNLPRVRAVKVDLLVTRSARNSTRADTIAVQPWIPLFNAR